MFGVAREIKGSVGVKICGLTRADDAALAADVGADAIGMIFWAGSRRCVDVDSAKALVARVPPDVGRVGVFVNAPAVYINWMAVQVGLTAVQLHGDEKPEILPKLALPVLKAVRAPAAIAPYVKANLDALVVDGAADGAYGGTGTAASAAVIHEARRFHPLVLAGGLTADNVADAIACHQPAAVDVSSGVETSPGVKDPAALAAFVAAARSAGSVALSAPLSTHAAVA